jgi:hypothetical protein
MNSLKLKFASFALFAAKISVPLWQSFEFLARISHQDHGSRRRIRVRKRRSGARSVAIATV